LLFIEDPVLSETPPWTTISQNRPVRKANRESFSFLFGGSSTPRPLPFDFAQGPR